MTAEKDTPKVSRIEDLIGPRATRPSWARQLVLGALAVGSLGALAFYIRDGDATDKGPTYVTEEARIGALNVSVSANGTLAPTRSVNIGSELSGTVARVLVDVNDRVKRGQVLAELDVARLTDQARRSQASVDAARARIGAAAATIQEASAKLARMQEAARLSGGKVPARTELEVAQGALERARAEHDAAKAALADAQAALSADQTNLRKASIRSPIDGLVLTRSVDPGNAVAASLQAVTLFTVAEDLSRMVLKVNIDEADVGLVKKGQSATFTVSAWPDRRYPATITRLGYGATIKDNVVTYVAELEVSNKDLTLRPGMTATAMISATELRDVLLVPNAALRFSPVGARGAPSAAATGSAGLVSKLMPRPSFGSSRRATDVNLANVRQVWVLRDGAPVALAIAPGLTDGRFTQVRSEALKAGDPVIVEQAAAR